MPNVTVTTPQTITVKVGPASPPTVTAISYGGGGTSGGEFAIKDATDINMTTAVDGGAIVFNALTNSFFVKTPNIDNGFF
jgi:hypothetical protein